METTTGAAARNASAEEVISVTELVPPPGDVSGQVPEIAVGDSQDSSVGDLPRLPGYVRNSRGPLSY